MHILIVAQQWTPERGVPQLRGAWFVEQLIQAGHSVDVITAPPHYPTGKLISQDPQVQAYAIAHGPAGETVYRANFRPHSTSIPSRIIDQAVVAATSIFVARRAVKKRKPDVIIATAPPLPTAFTAWVISKLSKRPFVLDLRDAWPDLAQYVAVSDYALRSAATLRSRLRQPLINAGAKIFNHLLKTTAGIIATTSLHQRELAERYKKPTITISNIEIASVPATHSAETNSATAQKITHSLLPTLETNPNQEIKQQQLDRKLRVLYAGTVGRAQDIVNLVIAADIARKANTPIELTIAGHGAHLRLAKEKAAELQVPVRFLGRVEANIVHKCYEWADVVCVILKDWEPLRFTIPSKSFELIASGKYVLGALQGAGAELIQKAGAGSTVAPGQPQALAAELIRLATHQSELAKNANGAQWVKKARETLNSSSQLNQFITQIGSTWR